MISDYFTIMVFLGVVVLVSVLLATLPMFFAAYKPDSEKLSSYECGFNQLSSARKTFDVRFYLVTILFIIFDLEIAFLFPWAVSLAKIGSVGFWSMVIFLLILTVGFIYEWNKGALEWE
ncbi:NADH-quinone oxidoreductase subunit A [Candidatus Mesenet endosymbiont of Phosphuga atrata]|uniref:NADH-quinone oxidoreductase subunit A n=1 Tax=Candidatus Mesenet endosymbiont of Phosphuga atrata TaxID=3066221 RepID=UPI0030CD2077